MEYSGNLSKMASSIDMDKPGATVNYSLGIGGESINMNKLVGSRISLSYLGSINCIHCGRKTSKSFAQGYCYPCFVSLPQTDSCILRPETCLAQEGISRDMEWSKNNCLTDHIVYLALSPGLKVGVTRLSQVPTRWIDQGASMAIKLARTPNRHTAGVIEVNLKKYLSDKTKWRDMLTGVKPESEGLLTEKERVVKMLIPEMRQYISEDNYLYEIEYPVLNYPQKVKPVNLDVSSFVEGILAGIKGQYLILNDGAVLNIRKYGGYLVKIET